MYYGKNSWRKWCWGQVDGHFTISSPLAGEGRVGGWGCANRAGLEPAPTSPPPSRGLNPFKGRAGWGARMEGAMKKKKNGASVIDRVFKIRFGMKLCLVATSGLIAVTAIVYSAASQKLGGNYAEAVYTIADLKIKIFPLIFASFYTAGILAFATISTAVISLFFSHKIAGPVYRMERSLEAVESGDLTIKTTLRSGDQLMPVAEDVNEMVRSLNHRVKCMNEALGGIESDAQRLSALLQEADFAASGVMETAVSLGSGVEGLKRAAALVRLKEC